MNHTFKNAFKYNYEVLLFIVITGLNAYRSVWVYGVQKYCSCSNLGAAKNNFSTQGRLQLEQKNSQSGQGAPMALTRMIYEHLCHVATQLQLICLVRF